MAGVKAAIKQFDEGPVGYLEPAALDNYRLSIQN
jgi:hypothetical protein